MRESYMAISPTEWAIGRDPIEALQSLIYIGKKTPNKYVLYYIAGDDSPLYNIDTYKFIHRAEAKVNLIAMYQNTMKGYVQI